MDTIPKKNKVTNKIKILRNKLKEYNIDGYVVPKNDDYFTEYSKINRLKIISNFSGSAGLAIILKNKNYLFTDGRYTIQSRIECGKNFKIIGIEKLINCNLFKVLTLGIDPKLFTYKQIKKSGHIKLLQIVLDESGYSAMLKNKKDLDNENRLENIKELLSAMKEFDTLESFLEHVSLATSVDQEWDGEKVNLMTMHASKGLEFDAVFLPGWEEGLFPHQRSIDEKGHNGLEEERRLAYVGITRAKKVAHISFSMNRFYQGDWIDSISSRFIDELPEKFIEKKNNYEIIDDEPFDFNQDIDNENSDYKSPGWIRYQKRIK